MEVVADIDEANQQQLLFIQDQPTATHTDKRHKGKSTLHSITFIASTCILILLFLYQHWQNKNLNILNHDIIIYVHFCLSNSIDSRKKPKAASVTERAKSVSVSDSEGM